MPANRPPDRNLMNRTPVAHRSAHGPLLMAVMAAALLVAVPARPSYAAPPDKQAVHDFATGNAITGTFSMLDRGDEAIASTIRTTATPGHAITLWYVIFNAPENCSDGMCGADDLFLDPAAGGAGGFNAAQIGAARISVVYGGDGAVANAGGRLALDGGLAEGEVPTGANQVVIGAGGALVPLGPVSGLEDAQAAEVHIVLQDHGLADDDPAVLASQLSSFNGGCNPTCWDIQFSVHLPLDM